MFKGSNGSKVQMLNSYRNKKVLTKGKEWIEVM